MRDAKKVGDIMDQRHAGWHTHICCCWGSVLYKAAGAVRKVSKIWVHAAVLDQTLYSYVRAVIDSIPRQGSSTVVVAKG